MNLKLLTCPYIRTNIIGSFDYLADYKIQKKEWVDPNYKHSFWDSIDINVFDTLYEECELDENISEKIGVYFYDKEEAEAVHKYCIYFRNLLEKIIGVAQPDSAYIGHPEWPSVVEGAKRIYDLMKRKNEEYRYEELRDKIDSGEIDLNKLIEEENKKPYKPSG
jgi:hypothetical protein